MSRPTSRSDIIEKRRSEELESRQLAMKIASAPLGLGGAYALVETVFGSAARRRQEQILRYLEHDLQSLINRVDGIDEVALSKNEAFISTAMQAVQIALRTHQQEKLEALRNAITNAALPGSPDFSLQQVFLSYVDRFTEWHMRILRMLQNPRAYLEDIDPDDFVIKESDALSRYVARDSQYTKSAFPDMEIPPHLVTQIRRDLNSCGLSKWDDFGPGTPEKFVEVWFRPKTTEFGDAFLRFIEEPPILREDSQHTGSSLRQKPAMDE